MASLRNHVLVRLISCLLLHMVYGVQVEYKNYWESNGPIFQAEITIVAETDLTGGWEMLVTFNQPVYELILWSQDVVSQPSDRSYVINNSFDSHLEQGQTLTFEFQGRYRDANNRPDDGTAVWYGSSVGSTSSPTPPSPSSSTAPSTPPTSPSTAARTTTTTAPQLECYPVTIIRKECHGYRGVFSIQIPRDIEGWTGRVYFTHPTLTMNMWSSAATWKNPLKTIYYIRSHPWNAVRQADEILELNFYVRYNLQELNGFEPCVEMSFMFTESSTTTIPSTSETTKSTTASTASTASTSTTASTASTASTSTTASTASTTSTSPNLALDYDQAIEYSLMFYEAQRSGVLPADNRISYRGDSSVNDGSDVGLDLSGGWHDAGDHVKFGLPMSASTTMLLYGLIFFKQGYQSANQYNEGLRQIRWPLDYFMKCHQRTDRFYAQVGNGDIDHAWWGRPEEMSLQRPSYVVGAGATSSGGADVMGETAAALAAASILFKNADPTYSQYLLSNATSLYQLGKDNTGTYNAAVPDGAKFYSSSGWTDEMAHAAAWLAKAHESMPPYSRYLSEAEAYLEDGSIWALDWSDKRGLVNLLLYELTGGSRFSGNINTFLQAWLPGGSMPRTPQGLVYRLQWGSLRYSANAAFLALLSAQQGLSTTSYISFAESQIHYMLGSTGRSYVVGFGVNPPKRAHHKAASCPLPSAEAICDWEDYNANRDNPNVLFGALVGGPDSNDGYTDDRTDFQRNEVTTDYNAGFTGALAGLKYFALNPQ